MLLSKWAAIEQSSLGVGVSVRVRKYWRAYYLQHNLPSMLGDNKTINDLIAGDYSRARPVHRFWLKSGEAAEIRKSSTWYYVGVLRQGGKQDVIAIQPAYKEAPQEISTERLKPEWVQQGPKKRRLI